MRAFVSRDQLGESLVVPTFARRAGVRAAFGGVLLLLTLASFAAASGSGVQVDPAAGNDEPGFSRAEGSLDAGYRRSYRFGFYVSPFYWGWSSYAWPYVEAAWYNGPYYGGAGAWGAVDLNIKPKNAEVFVDGDYVGRVDQFDGFPRYLWLERGTRHLVIYKPGFETMARKIKVRPGGVLDIRELMVPGEAKTPEELFEQLEPARQKVEPYERGSASRPVEPPSDETWRERQPRERSGVVVDQRMPPGRLVVSVTPVDAVVYLDEKLLGSGEELSRLHHGLIVDQGEHVLEFVRPGYATRTQRISVPSGEDVELEILLDRDPG